MERVAQLLQQQDFRQALVRLWVLGSDAVRLNEWERIWSKNKAQHDRCAQKFKRDLEQPGGSLTEQSFIDEINAAPLALIQALDRHVQQFNARYNKAARDSRPELARIEDGKGYWLTPIVSPVRATVSLIQQSANLAKWFRFHAVLPQVTAHGLRVAMVRSQSTLDEALSRLLAGPNPQMKVWLAHFNDGACVACTGEDTGNVLAQSVVPHDVRVASLLATMATASDAGANMVVFPEFTLDLAQRQILKALLQQGRWPSIALVLAGSFHESIDGDYFNTAPCYDALGCTVFVHRKIRPFGDDKRGREDIRVGNTLSIVVTPVGCITTLICKDFMDVDHHVEGLLTEVPVDWVLVPSFGDAKTIRGHLSRAKSLATVKTGTHTAVAQTLNTLLPSDESTDQCVRGFAHVAGRPHAEPHVSEQGGLVVFPLTLEARAPKPTASKTTLKRIK